MPHRITSKMSKKNQNINIKQKMMIKYRLNTKKQNCLINKKELCTNILLSWAARARGKEQTALLFFRDNEMAVFHIVLDIQSHTNTNTYT